MSQIVWIAVFWTFGLTLSLLTWNDRVVWSARTYVLLGVTALFLASLCGALAYSGGGPASGFSGGLLVVIGAIFVGPFFARAASECIFASASVMVSESNQQRPMSHDKALAARKRGDLELAQKLYQEAIATCPQDIDAYHELAEVMVLRGNVRVACSTLASAYQLVSQPDIKGPIGLRIAELQQAHPDLGDPRQTLKDLACALAGTRFEQYAHERLAGL